MYRLLFAACLLVVACSAAPKSPSDTNELRSLLEQIRGYLNVKVDEKRLSTRKNAYDDVVTVKANPNAVFDPSAGGYWSAWQNVDKNPDYGYGEYEDCSRVKWQQNMDKKCYLGCSEPIAYRYSVVDANTKASWAEIAKCIGPMDSKRQTSCGFRCVNKKAAAAPKTGCDKSRCVEFGLGKGCTRCPNVRVQFFCTGTKPNANECCPYSKGCSIEGRRDMRSALEAIKDIDARRDAVAQLMVDVRAALTVDDDDGGDEDGERADLAREIPESLD
jgi:hypothetical protein